MTILSFLSSSLGLRDEVPNQQLAQKIVDSNDIKAVKELVHLLQNSKQAIQYDCIKVLYEIGERNPKMILPFHHDFLTQLKSKNNRIVWGTMTALSIIAQEKPEEIFKNLSAIMQAADAGSVIAKDHV